MARILIVEDDLVIQQTVSYALRRAGFETLTSSDGLDGLRIAQSETPDLILLDLMLPGLDGYRFAEEVRRVNSNVAIIMMTALDTDRDAIRGLDAGADDYISKPFSTELLLARVRANLRRVREESVLKLMRSLKSATCVLNPLNCA